MSNMQEIMEVEDVVYPSDHLEASIEHELLSTLSSAARNMSYNRVEFIAFVEGLCDLVWDDIGEDILDHENPF